MMRNKELTNRVIWRELFYFTACLWLALVLLEIVFPNIVLVYFNLNYLLAVVAILGLVSAGKWENSN